MTTKAQALDHLTDVLAGEDVAGEPTVAGAIDKLATMIEDGEITIGGGGGGGGVVEIPFEIDETTQNPTCTMTANEIITIIKGGSNVIGKVSMVDGTDTNSNYFPVFNYLDAANDSYVDFCNFFNAPSGLTAIYAMVSNNDTQVVTYQLQASQ